MRRILYLQYTNPAAYPPLEHSAHLLAEAGWKVRFLGSGASGAADRLRIARHPSIEVFQRPFLEPGWRQKLDYIVYGLWVLWQAWIWRPQWVYASDPLVCPVALLVAWLTPSAVLYHEHDSPNEGDAASPTGFERLRWSARRRLARRAQLCVLPNAQRIEIFRRRTGRRSRVECVWNCPRLAEIAPPRSGEAASIELHLYYHGSLIPARLPMSILRAMQTLLGKVRLTIVGYETIGARDYARSFNEEVARLGLSDSVEALGVRSRQDLLRLCPSADVGIALMPTDTADLNESTMIGASNKPFDYLARGMALLVADRPDWRVAFVDPGFALACNPDDAESVAAALRWFVNHPEETRLMGERGRLRLATGWNYEAQFAPVQALLEERLDFQPASPAAEFVFKTP